MERAKKECILIEAAKAFGRFGFKKVSIDEIAKKAGVAKGTVYLAAESKEDLFYQVLNREVRAWVAECSKVIDPRVSADRLLSEVLQASVGYVDSHPLVRELLFGETNELMPSWTDRLEDLRTLGQANLVEILRLGVRQKIFRADLEIETIASMLQDLEVASYLFHARGPDARERLQARGRVGLDLVLNGLKAHAS